MNSESTTTTTDPAGSESAATTKGTTTAAGRLQVRGDEDPWTKDELTAVKSELETDVERLNAELRGVESEIAELIDDSGDGAGDDQADVGTKSFEREHEFTLAQNSQVMLEQCNRALERLANGTYGICENCEKAIGKLRLQAFPRATLCVQCKQKQERR